MRAMVGRLARFGQINVELKLAVLVHPYRANIGVKVEPKPISTGDARSRVEVGAGMHRSMVTQRSRVTTQKDEPPTENENTTTTHEADNNQYHQVASTSIHYTI